MILEVASPSSCISQQILAWRLLILTLSTSKRANVSANVDDILCSLFRSGGSTLGLSATDACRLGAAAGDVVKRSRSAVRIQSYARSRAEFPAICGQVRRLRASLQIATFGAPVPRSGRAMAIPGAAGARD